MVAIGVTLKCEAKRKRKEEWMREREEEKKRRREKKISPPRPNRRETVAENKKRLCSAFFQNVSNPQFYIAINMANHLIQAVTIKMICCF